MSRFKELWEVCFGDEASYIDFYMENRMTDSNMLVLHEDGKIVSMASFLPVNYEHNGEETAARYVYAVATLPEIPGTGICVKDFKLCERALRTAAFACSGGRGADALL